MTAKRRAYVPTCLRAPAPARRKTQRPHVRTSARPHGFTLIEIMLGTSIMVIVLVAMLGSFFGQSTLNLNSRNTMAALNDATRVMEQIRQQNTGSSCQNGIPSVVPPFLPESTTTRYVSWDAWLNAQNPAKTVQQPPGSVANNLEVITVTCQDQDGGKQTSDYCGYSQSGSNPPQIGQEWFDPYLGRGAQNGNTIFDPIRVTVSVGWWTGRRGQALAYGSRTIPGMDFNYSPFTRLVYTGPDEDNDGVLESPAMLTTMVTCR